MLFRAVGSVALAAAVGLMLLLCTRPARAGSKAVDGVVNVNTAPPGTLAMLPGIGLAKVQSILEYRQRRPFRTVDELVRIKGISSKMVRHLRPHLATSGPTTARLLTTREMTLMLEAPPAPAPPPQKKVVVAGKSGPAPAARPGLGAPGSSLGARTRRSERPARANLCLPRR
ncbi:MAG TPA: helix-hairpin-helix domain-containing protein [Polyangia bacterium]|nr:helix-hairpin-helix domain-containing protein [Polyangia bacterium]